MNLNTQEIRESQFILVYGPGAIIESTNGSRLIPDIYHCFNNDDFSNETFIDNEFNDVRMSSVIKSIKKIKGKGVHLFSLPLYSSLKKYSKLVYNTYIFPEWKICHETEKLEHGGIGSVLYNSARPDNKKKLNKCPVCERSSDTNVRFLLACRDGHLDDINWENAVHRGSNIKCNSNWFIWKPEGSSPAEIKIQCPNPKCKKEVNMLDIYGMKFECTGRLPEKQMPLTFSKNVSFANVKDDINEDCDLDMFVVQRQSTSLRVANPITLLRMPRAHDYVISILLKNNYKFVSALIEMDLGLDEILMGIKKYSENDYKKIKKYFEKEENNFDSFKNSFLDVIKESNFHDALIDEFSTLITNEPILNDNNFKKGKFVDNYYLDLFNKKLPIKICPIYKLKTVTAQISYHRKPEVKTDNSGNLINKSVSTGYEMGDEIWFPAYESVGEGIFITSDKNPIDFLNLEDMYNKWNQFIKKIDTWGRDEIKDPLFVWWHTLSHAIINSLSLSCGYNSTALKERVYINGSKVGILIYNTSPGEDSGMGGLVDLVDSFENVLENAMHNLKFCSNDPLCFKEEIKENKVNGAACHNCLLISETSCEHRNSLLDRHFFFD